MMNTQKGRGEHSTAVPERAGHLKACQLQSLVLRLFVNPFSFHTKGEFKLLLCSISNAQSKNAQSLLKLSSYSVTSRLQSHGQMFAHY